MSLQMILKSNRMGKTLKSNRARKMTSNHQCQTTICTIVPDVSLVFSL